MGLIGPCMSVKLVPYCRAGVWEFLRCLLGEELTEIIWSICGWWGAMPCLPPVQSWASCVVSDNHSKKGLAKHFRVETGTNQQVSGSCCLFSMARFKAKLTGAHSEGATSPCPTSFGHCLWVGDHWRRQSFEVQNTRLAAKQTSMNRRTSISVNIDVGNARKITMSELIWWHLITWLIS